MNYQYRSQDKHSHTKSFLTIFVIGILLGSFGSYLYLSTYSKIVTIQNTSQIYQVQEPVYYRVQINLAAVDQNGKGVTTPLVIEAKPGKGETLTNIDKLLFWTDTQQSIQTAKAVAENVTKISASNYDITYTIESNASIIGGPSAGAALTIATIAALKNEKLKSDVMITGTINDDGTIGQVGGVLEKAQAAKYIGAKLFLVPKGQGTETYLKPEENCTRTANFVFCQTTYKQVDVNIGKDAGISVIEVSNVTEAYNYFKL